MKNLKKMSLPITVIKSLILLLLVSSCELLDKENPSSGKGNETTHYGPAVPMGNGKAQSFITLTRAGIPTAMGVALSEKALENLPTLPEGHHNHRTAGATNPFEFLVQLPNQASMTPFKFITVDWAPMGHEPVGVYDSPHFDFHFYLIANEERLSITPLADMDPEIPQAKYIPAPYIQLPGRVPNMGVHWIDPRSPELAGETFTRTFIYGTYKEKVAFMEPMITLDYIKSKPNHINEVPLAEAFQISGFYPSKYQVKYNPTRKEYLIMYTDFSYKAAE